jgi:hypothetical protein
VIQLDAHVASLLGMTFVNVQHNQSRKLRLLSLSP